MTQHQDHYNLQAQYREGQRFLTGEDEDAAERDDYDGMTDEEASNWKQPDRED